MQRTQKLFLEGLVLLLGAGLLVAGLEPDQSDSSQTSVAPDVPTKSEKLTVFKPELVSDGFVLLPVEGNAEVQLLSNFGNVVHTWKVDASRARLLPNGHLLVVHGTKWGNEIKTWRKLRNVVREYNWDGQVVWEYRADDVLHHDVQRLANGNTLILKRTEVPQSMYSQIRDDSRMQESIRSDSVLEVTPAGEIVWEWHAHDHFDLNSCGSKGCVPLKGKANSRKGMRDWTHINTISVLPDNQWYRAGNKAFRPGNIIVLPRNWWTIFIVDRETGDIVWRYEGDYRGGLSGGHEAHMIEEGLPGAGNILVFDNGRKVHKGESFALEIQPETKAVKWVYDVGTELYTPARGSLQRLKNGNTLISEDKPGRCFEVDSAGTIVWEYREQFELNRCHRYPLTYAPQLAG